MENKIHVPNHQPVRNLWDFRMINANEMAVPVLGRGKSSKILGPRITTTVRELENHHHAIKNGSHHLYFD
jgi:hypothetical protein